MMCITIVCCYNRDNDYNEFKKSLKAQSADFKLVGIDNTRAQFSSCAAAFNSILSKVDTKYVIFSHQDILFTEPLQLTRFVHFLNQTNDGDILGVAGRSDKAKRVFSNIRHGTNQEYAGENRLTQMIECDTVDECFFGGTVESFKRYPFDEKLCNGWHLYAVERCMAAKVRGNKVWVCAMPLIHNSRGKMDYKYSKQFYHISRKYSKYIRYMRTTCACAYTRFPMRELAYIVRNISMTFGRY